MKLCELCIWLYGFRVKTPGVGGLPPIRLYGFFFAWYETGSGEVYEIIFHGAERDDSCRRKIDGSSVERGLALLAARFSIYLSIYLSSSHLASVEEARLLTRGTRLVRGRG